MKKFLALLIIFVVGNCAFALNIYKLDNGQTVVIQEVHSNPIVTVDTWIKTGSVDETDKNNGVAHFLEHLFFKGTKKHPPGEFDKILENKGAITNAATSKDYTHYYITLPSQYFDLALELHADMLLNPLVPRKELEMERKVVLEEIAKDLNSPGNIVYNNLVDMLYTTHPYKRKVIGTQEVISTITRDDIMNFYNEHYFPSNMVTIIIGDVNTAEALAKVKENFTGEYKKTVKTANTPEKRLTAPALRTQNFPTETGYLLLGFRSTPVSDKDSYALDVLSVILGGGRSSVLNQSVKENKQLAFSISAVNSGYKEDGIFYISANFTPEKLDRLKQAVFEEIQKIQKDGVTNEQLQLAKNIIETNTYYERESISNIAGEIGYTFITTGDIKYYDTYLDNIKKVTAKEVKDAADKYLGVDKSAASILLPEKKPEKLISHKSQVNAQEVSKSRGTEDIKLSTGMTMLVTQNDINDIIALSIVVKGGYLVEEIPGTADMAASVMTKGTAKYTSVELAQILEDNGIKIAPGAGSDAFTISILTTKKQYKKTLELLDEIVNNAAFVDNEIEKTRAEKLSAIKRSRDVPLNLAVEGYKTLIYEGSPYSNSSAIMEKTLPTVQRADIVSYYETIFNPQNIVVSINGNLSSEEKEDTYTVFGKIFPPKEGAKFAYSNYSIPDL
ncbi:MAG: insulinase family protein, partial [Heliobacteriaceae bacterium]|nr:insulinase family protein [Heliobacteriaceae bacterium]